MYGKKPYFVSRVKAQFGNLRKSPKKKAEEILEAAVRRAEKVRRLPDEALQKIVMKYIDSILPRGAS